MGLDGSKGAETMAKGGCEGLAGLAKKKIGEEEEEEEKEDEKAQGEGPMNNKKREG